MLTVFVDTDCDVTPEIANQYGFKLISMPYIIGDKVYYPYKDESTFDFVSFYESLKNGVMPKTTALNSNEYIEYFEPEFSKGNDILYIHFSSALSGTFNAMNLAVNELKEKYPERKFYAIDTLAITILGLNIIRDIGKKYLEGKGAEELVEYAETIKQKYAVYFFATDLDFFKRSGRVSNFQAVMGNLIGLKPIIYINEHGIMTSISRARGMAQVVAKILGYIEELGDDIKNTHIIIGHTGAIDCVELVKKRLVERYGEGLDIEELYVNPVAGAHCGPNCLGVSFHSTKR